MPRKRRLTARELLLFALPLLAVALIFASRRFYDPPHPIVGAWQAVASPGVSPTSLLTFYADGTCEWRAGKTPGAAAGTSTYEVVDRHDIRLSLWGAPRKIPFRVEGDTLTIRPASVQANVGDNVVWTYKRTRDS